MKKKEDNDLKKLLEANRNQREAQLIRLGYPMKTITKLKNHYVPIEEIEKLYEGMDSNKVIRSSTIHNKIKELINKYHN